MKKAEDKNSKKKLQKMVYIFNKYIAPKKTIKVALTTILGIGQENSKKITEKLCINPNHRFLKINPKKIDELEKYISRNLTVNIALKKNQKENIKRLIQIKSNRGLRHSKGLPVHGQRTKSNSRTQRKLAKSRTDGRIK